MTASLLMTELKYVLRCEESQKIIYEKMEILRKKLSKKFKKVIVD